MALNPYIFAALALLTTSLVEAVKAPTNPPWASSGATNGLVKRDGVPEVLERYRDIADILAHSTIFTCSNRPDFLSLSGGPSHYKRPYPAISPEAPQPRPNHRAEFAAASIAAPLEWHASRTPSQLYGSSRARQESDGYYEDTYDDVNEPPYWRDEPPRRPSTHHDYDYQYRYRPQNVKPQSFVPVVAVRPMDVAQGKHFRAARPVAATGLGDFTF